MIRKLIDVLRQTFKEWSEAKVPRLAAALSYYTIFSIPPMIVLALGIAGLVIEPEEAKSLLLDQVGMLLSAQTAQALSQIVDAVLDQQTGAVATLVGIAVSLVGASGVFGQLQDALNTIWEVAPKPGQGIKLLVQKRLFSFLIVLGTGFLLLVSLVLSTALAILGQWLQTWLPASPAVTEALNFLISFLVITLLFTFMFVSIPDARVAWKDAWVGAMVTSLLFNLGKTLLGIYLGRSNPGSVFGAAASVVLVLVWVYYSAQILFFGAAFTKVYAERWGSGVTPEPHAEKVTDLQRAREGIPPRTPAPSQNQPNP